MLDISGEKEVRKRSITKFGTFVKQCFQANNYILKYACLRSYPTAR